MDENGDIAVVVNDFAEALVESLKKCGVDNSARRDWLESLLAAYLKDHDMGGVYFASGVEDAIIQQATDEEWRSIEERVRAIAESSREWGRKSLIDFLDQGLKRRKRQGKVKSSKASASSDSNRS